MGTAVSGSHIAEDFKGLNVSTSKLQLRNSDTHSEFVGKCIAFYYISCLYICLYMYVCMCVYTYMCVYSCGIDNVFSTDIVATILALRVQIAKSTISF